MQTNSIFLGKTKTVLDGQEIEVFRYGLKVKKELVYVLLQTSDGTPHGYPIRLGLSVPPLKYVIWLSFSDDVPPVYKRKVIDTILRSMFDKSTYIKLQKELEEKIPQVKRQTLLESEDRKLTITEKIDRAIHKLGLYAGGIFTLISVLFLLKGVFDWAKAKISKWNAVESEKEVDRRLFEPTRDYESAFEVYSFLISTLKLLLSKKSIRYGLLVYGPPGTGKTFVVRRTLYLNNVKYTLVKGSETSITSFFTFLYENKNGVLVLDDFDTFLRDEAGVNIIKGLLDSYPRRTVSLIKYKEDSRYSSSSFALETIPDKFEFTGKLIIITNMKRQEIDPAILSRCYTVEVNFDAKQMLNIIEKMLVFIHPHIPMDVKREVFDYVAQVVSSLNVPVHIDFRTIMSAIDLRIAYPENWQPLVKQAIYSLMRS